MAVTYTSNEWARVAATTIRDYIREEENDIMRNRPVLAMLKNRGLVVRNVGGDGFSWEARYRRAPMQTNDGEQPIDFARQNRWDNAHLDYAGYLVADQVTKRERLKNKTNAALIKYFGRMASLLMEDIEDQFAEELYVDIDGTGNSERFTGLESMFGATQTIQLSDGTARTANAGDPVAYPNDTYAGLSTVLGTKGGSWSSGNINSTWPFGVGAAEASAYDFWSPVIVNYTSSAFDGSSTTWKANAVKAVRFMLDAINTRNKSKFGKCDLVLIDRGLYREYKDTLDSKERIQVTATSELKSLGFEGQDMIQQDGATIMSEYGVPSAVGYGLTVNAMQLRSMQSQLFVPTGPDFSMDHQAWRFMVDIHGQWRFHSPRHYGKLAAVA